MSLANASSKRYLAAVAEELDISDTRYEQAEKSYTSLGRWLNRPESTLKNYGPAVYVQGSFGLGTVIKPLNEDEEYDVDAVCELKYLGKTQLTQQGAVRPTWQAGQGAGSRRPCPVNPERCRRRHSVASTRPLR